MPATECRFGLVAHQDVQRLVLPLKAVRASFTVQGALAEVCFTQVYLQDNNRPLDCSYLFPLPADASVFSCEAFINDRVIRARVEEREAAVRMATEKKQAGHRTVLVESERENLFTLSLSNLQPDDLVEVRLSYIQPLRRLAGRLSLELPLNPGVRYIPGQPLSRANRGHGFEDDTHQVPDASRISPPRIDQFHPDAAFIDISGRVEAKFISPPSLTSPTHAVATRIEGDWMCIALSDKGEVPDQAVVFRWDETPAAAVTPRAWIHERNGEAYALLEIRAPERTRHSDDSPQDFYLLVDCSGSMEGEKWVKAVEALQSCIRELGPRDRAMITFFGSDYDDFAQRPLSPAEVLADHRFAELVDRGTGGGTEMAPALEHVLQHYRRYSSERRANLLLITDAQVGNDHEILNVMKAQPNLPVHAFGIDIALNDSLLQALCRQQGGTFHSLNPNDDVAAVVSNLGATLRQPVLLDLRLTAGWDPATGRIPNLYAGQVHYLSAWGKPGTALRLEAKDSVGTTLTLTFSSQDSPGVGPWLNWCKTRIQSLLAVDPQSREAVELSKEAGIICQLTAFVAWDEAQQVAVATQTLMQPALDSPHLAYFLPLGRRELRAARFTRPISCAPERSSRENKFQDKPELVEVEARLVRLREHLKAEFPMARDLDILIGRLGKLAANPASFAKLISLMDAIETALERLAQLQKHHAALLSELKTEVHRVQTVMDRVMKLIDHAHLSPDGWDELNWCLRDADMTLETLKQRVAQGDEQALRGEIKGMVIRLVNLLRTASDKLAPTPQPR